MGIYARRRIQAVDDLYRCGDAPDSDLTDVGIVFVEPMFFTGLEGACQRAERGYGKPFHDETAVVSPTKLTHRFLRIRQSLRRREYRCYMRNGFVSL